MEPVRRAGKADVPAIAQLLSRAFFEDPVATFLFPERVSRAGSLDRFFELQLCRNYLRRGVVHTTADLEAAALWMPPGAPSPTIVERLAHMAFSRRLGARRVDAHRLTTMLEARHPVAPHWYLGAIGTDPARQGQGHASALLEKVLAVCDETEVGAYLEASRPGSARLYERVGFEYREHFDPKSIGLNGPDLYLMFRPGRGRVPSE